MLILSTSIRSSQGAYLFQILRLPSEPCNRHSRCSGHLTPLEFATRSAGTAALRPNPFSAGYITNIAGFEFPTGTPLRVPRAEGLDLGIE